MSDDLKWYEIHDNLCLTADYMARTGFSAADLAYFVEKPYKYENEFNLAKEEYEREQALAAS